MQIPFFCFYSSEHFYKYFNKYILYSIACGKCGQSFSSKGIPLKKRIILKINICGMTLESMGKKKDQMWRKTHSSENK